MRTPVRKQEVKTVPVNQVPEVQKYVDAESKLQDFICANTDMMDQLDALVAARNDALIEADTAVRSKCYEYGEGVTCGPFRFKCFNTRVDGEAMYDTLGKEQFERLGGAIKHVPQYIPDKTRTIKAVENGSIDNDQVASFYKKIPTYHKIPEIVLP